MYGDDSDNRNITELSQLVKGPVWEERYIMAKKRPMLSTGPPPFLPGRQWENCHFPEAWGWEISDNKDSEAEPDGTQLSH